MLMSLGPTCLMVMTLMRMTEGSMTSHVICSISSYVKMGLEFDTCQSMALQQVSSHPEGNPCPMIRRVVDVCGSNVKACFTDWGWRRSQRVLLATLSLHYPETKECGLTGSVEAVEVMERIEGDEMCSVAMELNAAQKMAVCSNELQGKLVRSLRDMKPSERLESVCQAYSDVKEKCLDKFLEECHQGYDLQAQTAFALERLLIAADMLIMHVNNATNVAECPVFADNKRIDHDDNKSHSQYVLVVFIVLLLVIIVAMTTSILVWMALKLRLASRLKAWTSNTPYSDMVDDLSTHHEMSNTNDNNGQQDVGQQT